MTKNPLITVPSHNTDVCAWFQGAFESSFAVLHPFVRVADEHRHLLLGDGITRLQLGRVATVVSWAEILDICNIGGIGTLNVLLQESVLATENRHAEEVRVFVKCLKANHLLDPVRGDFPELLLDSFLRSFLELGHDSVTVGDEWGSASSTYPLTEMLGWEHPYVREAHPSLYCSDHKLLYGVHWDSFFTFLCGPRQLVERIVASYHFEGFFFRSGDPVYWGTYGNSEQLSGA